MRPALKPLNLVTFALAAACAAGLAHVLSVIVLRMPFDPNEGWNAYFAQAAMATGSPYPAATSLMVNNYPPLSFYLIGALAWPLGDAVIAGRLVALAALIATALGIARAARLMGCSRIEAAFAALLFAGGVMFTTDYAGMDDPQMLGHAVAMGGLLLALQEPRTPRSMLLSALLFVVAFFIKHNLVVLPLAAAAWLALAERRQATAFAMSGAIALLLGMGLFKEAFGTGLLQQIAAPRSYAFANVWAGLGAWWPWQAAEIAGTIALAILGRRDRHAMFCAIYAALAVAAGAFFASGAGVDANALFDADIALALGAGVLMNRLEGRGMQALASAIYAVPLLMTLWTADADWRTRDFWLTPMAQERVAARGDIALLRAARGPVICEMLSLCYWAGKRAEVDVFNLAQAYRTNARDDGALTDAIVAKHYAVIQLERGEAFPLTAKVRDALKEHYRVVREDEDRMFYAPN